MEDEGTAKGIMLVVILYSLYWFGLRPHAGRILNPIWIGLLVASTTFVFLELVADKQFWDVSKESVLITVGKPLTLWLLSIFV